MQFFGVTADDTPAFVIHDQASDAKYVKRAAAPADLAAWLVDFQARRRVVTRPMPSAVDSDL